MEARLARAALLFAVVLSTGAGYRTQNFIVTCDDAAFGQRVAEEAERFRRELAIEWLGQELAPWPSPCPIVVKFDQYASGRTSFGFQPQGGRSYPVAWDMEVCGSRERILDAVLPHEITHAIFATHFGQPLPRWADEGACTTVEHSSERVKHKQMLVEFLMTKRGIPFNRMFRMMEYPRDMLPLYAQGHSVADFLIRHEGRRHFVNFIGAGLQHQDWDRAVRDFYEYQDLSELQVTWNDWVRQGSKPFEPSSNVSASSSQEGGSLTGSVATINQLDQRDSDSSATSPVNGYSGQEVQGNVVSQSGSKASHDSESWYFAMLREHQGDQQGSVTYRQQLETADRRLIETIHPTSSTVWR